MAPSDYSGTLIGKIIVGADRAHFRLIELRLPEDRTFPICGIAADSFIDYDHPSGSAWHRTSQAAAQLAPRVNWAEVT